MASFLKNRKLIPGSQNSLEDVESLLNNLIVLNTFTIGFVINFLSSVDYDELITMDKMFATVWYNNDVAPSFAGTPEGKVILMSSLLLSRTWTSLILLSISLFMTIGMLIGLNYSDCREDKDFFRLWEKAVRPAILTAFVLFLLGSIYLYGATTIFSYGSFPKYCELTVSTFSVYADLSDVYNATSGEMIQGCVVSNMSRFGSDYINAINVLCPFLCCIFVLLSRYFRNICNFIGIQIGKEKQLEYEEDDKPLEIQGNPIITVK